MQQVKQTQEIIDAAYEADRAGLEHAFYYERTPGSGVRERWGYVHVEVDGEKYTVIRDEDQRTETAIFPGHKPQHVLDRYYVSKQ